MTDEEAGALAAADRLVAELLAMDREAICAQATDADHREAREVERSVVRRLARTEREDRYVGRRSNVAAPGRLRLVRNRKVTATRPRDADRDE